MSDKKKSIRLAFRITVFERDRYRCRICDRPGKDRQGGDGHLIFHKHLNDLVELDAHHIADRHLFPNGGYVGENGISLCTDCHIEAERHWSSPATARPEFDPDRLYELIKSSIDQAYEADTQLSG